MSERPAFQPAKILHHLVTGEVRFVLIGGLAAQAHGSPSLTYDIDICYECGAENLERLAVVLADLAAVRRGLPEGGPPMPPLDARTLRAGGLFTLTTRYGDFDLLPDPDPGLDYERLTRNATTAMVYGLSILIASLDDVIAMKRAAGRPKDRIELEVLGALREELDGRS